MPFPIALGFAGLVAEVAPGLIRHLAGDSVGAVADKVASVAKVVLGTDDPDGMRAAMAADPEKAIAFKLELAKVEKEYEDRERQRRHEKVLAELAGIQDARTRDLQMRQAGFNNKRADWMVAMAALTLIASLGGIVWLYYLTPADQRIPAEVYALLTLIANGAILCLRDAFQFEFGSSRGSQDKTVLLAQAEAIRPSR